MVWAAAATRACQFLLGPFKWPSMSSNMSKISSLSFAAAPSAALRAPVAVATAHQGKGTGQRLIAHGLDTLRREGVDIAVTYGDPAFYGRIGFKPVSDADLPAPRPLNQPQGWIAQSLTDALLASLRGPARCVTAFGDPALW